MTPDEVMDPSRMFKMLLWLFVFLFGFVVALAQFAPSSPHHNLPSVTGAIGAAEAYAAIDAENNGYVITRQEAVGSPYVRKDGTSIVHLRVLLANGEGKALVTVQLHRGWIADDITVRHTN